MKPLRIRASNVVAYRDLDIDVSDLRHLVITGENGAGKSLIIDILRVALHDHNRLGARALAGMIGRWGDTASVAVDYEHGGQVYRMTRTRRRAGKTTSRTDVHQMRGPDGAWTTLDKTAEDVIGLSAAALGATTFLRYRGVDGLGDFGASDPAARKAILGELRRTGRYDALREAANARATDAGRRANLAEGNLHVLRSDLEQALSVVSQRAERAAAVEALEMALRNAEDADASDRQHVQRCREAEACQKAACALLADATLARRRWGAERSRLAERVEHHRSALANADGVRAAAAERESLVVRHTDAAARVSALREERGALERVMVDARRALEHGQAANLRAAQAAAAAGAVTAAEANAAALGERLAQLDAWARADEVARRAEAADGRLREVPCGGQDPFSGCPLIAAAVLDRFGGAGHRAEAQRLGAAIAAEIRQTPSASVRASVAADHAAAVRHAAQRREEVARLSGAVAVDVEALARTLDGAEAEARATNEALDAAQVELDAITARGREVRYLALRLPDVLAAEAGLSADEASLVALGDGKDLDARMLEAERAASEATQALEHLRQRQPTAVFPRANATRTRLMIAQQNLAAVEAQAGIATARQASIAAAEGAAAIARREKATAEILARFAREAPSIIAENDRGAIEAAANAWLQQTSDLAVQLVFQRPQIGDASKVKETLDVDVVRPSGRAVRETCSGGELFRVDVGLAVGIGRAMGADRCWLCIDEGFGSLKGDVVTQVTRSLEGMLEDLEGLWVISHVQAVIDVFPARLVVRRGEDGSTVEVVRG